MHFLHRKYFISLYRHFNTLELTAKPEIILVSIIINNITLSIDQKSYLAQCLFRYPVFSVFILSAKHNSASIIHIY